LRLLRHPVRSLGSGRVPSFTLSLANLLLTLARVLSRLAALFTPLVVALRDAIVVDRIAIRSEFLFSLILSKHALSSAARS
jgi:hypothetical protein